MGIISMQLVILLTLPDPFFLRRFTIGLTPVSLGSKRTNEKPNRRCRRISAASPYVVSVLYKEKVTQKMMQTSVSSSKVTEVSLSIRGVHSVLQSS